ncbi:hypothetical protein TrCOL_g1871 [Triparma columacea]|nr:hypothetical protein TrCOL_g1871 [Triparma columacea]
MISSKRESSFLANVVHLEPPLCGRKIEEVYSGVHSGPIIGSGVSGVVRQVVHRTSGAEYAVKCMNLTTIRRGFALKQLKEEVQILVSLDHPNIVRLEEVYESKSEIYLVFEQLTGGELFDRLDEQPDYHYTETLCAHLVQQMLSAVRYCHERGIIHRDLKLENFIFEDRAAGSELKLIDFGLSKHFEHGDVQHEAVGTPYTVAPEVILGSYNSSCDIWAVGVITYLLLSGDTPFGGCGGESLEKVRENILKGNVDFTPEEIWGGVSDGAKQFIRDLLRVDPSLRPGAAEAQNHPWISSFAAKRGEGTGACCLSAKTVQNLVTFKSYGNMRKLICEIISFTLMAEQIRGLRTEFEMADEEGSGEISLQGLKRILKNSAGSGNMGALTEEEVGAIFENLKMSKHQQNVHYHEFIAACLSQCEIDDRNLLLAFERMDSERKGYITVSNVRDLMGCDATEEAVEEMFKDAKTRLRETGVGGNDKITFEDFVKLMKGQDGERNSPALKPAVSRQYTSDSEGDNLLGATAAGFVNGICGEGGIDDSFYLDAPQTLSEQSALPPPAASAPVKRREKSKSFDDTHLDRRRQDSSSPVLHLGRVFRRARENSLEVLIVGTLSEGDDGGGGATPLKESRRIYRSHRQMRIAILEASRRFEEKTQKRDGGPTLTIKKTPPRQGFLKTIKGSEEREEDEILELPNKEGGEEMKKERKMRIKVMSDISGMM